MLSVLTVDFNRNFRLYYFIRLPYYFIIKEIMLSKALLNIVKPRPLMIASQRCSSGKSAMGFSENTDAANSSQYVVS